MQTRLKTGEWQRWLSLGVSRHVGSSNVRSNIDKWCLSTLAARSVAAWETEAEDVSFLNIWKVYDIVYDTTLVIYNVI